MIGAGIAAFVLVLVALGWALVASRDTLERGWARLSDHRSARMLVEWMQAGRSRLPGWLRFGVWIGVGGAAVVIAVWLFVRIAAGVVSKAPITLLDTLLADTLHATAGPGLVAAMRLITRLGDNLTAGLVALVLAFRLVHERRFYDLAGLAAAVPGGMLLNTALKNVFDRPRPSFEESILTLETYSFPSGHAMISTLLYGTIAVLVIREIRSWTAGVIAALGATLVIGLVAFSRMVLGVHYLSDVLAGIVAGMAWLAVCLMATHGLKRRW